MWFSFPICHNALKHLQEMKRKYIVKGRKGKSSLMLHLFSPQNSSHFVSENEILKMNSASSKVVAKIFDWNESGVGRFINGTKRPKFSALFYRELQWFSFSSPCRRSCSQERWFMFSNWDINLLVWWYFVAQAK